MKLKARSQTVRIPAPVGGVNSVADLEHLPPSDCIDALNLISNEKGIRTRPGYRAHHTKCDPGSIDDIRTLLPYIGLTGDKLFGVTAGGIMDVTTSSDSSGTTFLFPTAVGSGAGYGHSVCAEFGGTKYLLYCDEYWGLHIYNGSAWSRGESLEGIAAPWLPSTYYAAGRKVLNGSNPYNCITAGTSDVATGPTGTGADITDGTAHWEYVGTLAPWDTLTAYAVGDLRLNIAGSPPAQHDYVCTKAGTSGVDGPSGTGVNIADGTCIWDYYDRTNLIGPSLAAQNAGLTLDLRKWCHVSVWKNRLWFVQKETGRGWYSGVNALFGPYTQFDFSYRAKQGGPLVALASWSYDAGGGLDTLLCAFTTGGDAVVFAGTDPDYADTMALKGVWNVGPLLNGRRVVTDYGGELLVLSRLGVVSMTKLLTGTEETGIAAKVSLKVGNLLGDAMAAAGTLGSVLFVDPTENALVAATMDANGLASTKYVMSFATGGWCPWENGGATCYALLGNTLYFGDKNGVVHYYTGGLDAVARAGTGGTAINWSLLTPFTGDFSHRMAHQCRPTILTTETGPLVEAKMHYDFDLGLDLPSASTTSTVVGGSYVASSPVLGLSGCGRHAALEVGGRAKTRTVFIGADVVFEQGRP